MIIGDINGNLITLTDTEFQEAMLAGTINSLAISASYNKGTAVTRTVDIPQTVTWSCLGILFSAYVKISQIYIKNLITGQRVGLLSEPHVNYDSNSVTALKTKIQNKLNSIGISGFTQTTLIADDYSSFDYSISELPVEVAMDTLEYELSGITTSLYFSQALSTGLIISNDIIYITPAFFGLTQFVEGIYNIELSMDLDRRVIYQTSGCYFLDLTLKCRLSLTTDLECGLNTAQMQYLMMHYSLVTASNCQCDCEKMHVVYQFLNRQLPYSSNTQDCGCY